MKAARHSLGLAVVLAAACVARADLALRPVAATATPAASPSALPPEPVSAPTNAASPCADTGRGLAGNCLSGSSLFGVDPWASVPLVPAAAEPDVRELPGLPSSSSLFLSAMLSVGAWHVVRKAGQAHWAHLPEWYHPDAPHQIGHSVAFDPSLGFELLAVCVFDVPSAAEPARFPDTPRELPSRCESQHFLSVEAPRGPPGLS